MPLNRRMAVLFGGLLGGTALAWGGALVAFHRFPLLLGTAFLAYTLGLRHAVDADHIAAIDNVTRKLMQQGQQPVTVGLYFSLGHSTVVFLLSALIAAASAALRTRFTGLQWIGGFLGTAVSALFLLAIAGANLVILRSLHRTFQRVRAGGRCEDEELNLLLAQRGFTARIFRGIFRMIGRSGQMYPVGFLFGLGFDTATEVGLLAISATEAARGLPVWAILLFPTLFAAGMALVDSADSVLMLAAYGWAFIKPVRKLYYNLTITFVSVVVALLVGGIEILSLVGDQIGGQGAVWKAAAALNHNISALGFAIIGIFIVSWGVSIAVYRWRRYDELEAAAGS